MNESPRLVTHGVPLPGPSARATDVSETALHASATSARPATQGTSVLRLQAANDRYMLTPPATAPRASRGRCRSDPIRLSRRISIHRLLVAQESQRRAPRRRPASPTCPLGAVG